MQDNLPLRCGCHYWTSWDKLLVQSQGDAGEIPRVVLNADRRWMAIRMDTYSLV